MTSITFEVAVLAEALRKAHRCSAQPGDKDSFSKAAGVVIDRVDEDAREVRVRSTNLEVFLTQWISYDEIQGDPAAMRFVLPSGKAASVASSIRSPGGKKIELAVSGGMARFSCGRMRAELRTISNPDFPDWEPMPISEMVACEGIGEALSLVQWARLKAGGEPAHWTGVFLDGVHAAATNRYALARQPLAILGLDAAFSIPAELLGPILKDCGQVMVGMGQGYFCVQPDDWSQLRTVVYAGKPPQIQKIARDDYEHVAMVDKQELSARLQSFAEISIKAEAPTVAILSNGIEMRFEISDGEQSITDVIELPSHDDPHDITRMIFSLPLLAEMVSRAPGSAISLHYDSSEAGEKRQPRLKITGDGGYQSWLASMNG